jgi:hypothetical protein
MSTNEAPVQPQMSAQVSHQPERPFAPEPPEDYCGPATCGIGALLFAIAGPLVLLTTCYKCDRRQWYPDNGPNNGCYRYNYNSQFW